MQNGDIIPPLALIEIIRVFRKAGGINDAEIGAVRRWLSSGDCTGVPPVPRFRLPDIVKAGPDKFTRNIIPPDRIQPGILRGHAPFHILPVICGDLICLLIDAKRAVFPAGSEGACGLTAVQAPFRMFPVVCVHSFFRCVIQPDNTAGIRHGSVHQDLRFAPLYRHVVGDRHRNRIGKCSDPFTENAGIVRILRGIPVDISKDLISDRVH